LKEFQVDEAEFCSLCKKCPGGRIARCLEYNKSLLNCLDGLPLREAARGGNIEVVDTLLATRGILLNQTNAHGLTALHFATLTDNADLVRKLLDHSDIQPNIEDKKGFTPVMLASLKGKTNSLKVLLEHPHVEFDMINEEGDTLEDRLNQTHLDKSTKKDILKISEAAMKRKGTKDRKKAAIFVLNWKYQDRHYNDLLGILDDVKIVKEVFKNRGYHVRVLENSKDIDSDVCNLLEKDEEFKNCARDAFQFIYMGHGIHKIMAEKHERGNHHINELGDCLVNVDGSLCSELRLSLSIAQELPENTTMCFLYDMCRVETRKQAERIKIEIDTFGLKKEFSDLGGDERTIKVFSAGLGQEAVDNNSFLNLLCQAVKTSYNGVRFVDMESERFLRGGQKANVEGKIRLINFEEFWPLH